MCLSCLSIYIQQSLLFVPQKTKSLNHFRLPIFILKGTLFPKIMWYFILNIMYLKYSGILINKVKQSPTDYIHVYTM